MEIKTYKRLKIVGIILSVVGIITFLFILFSFYPFPMGDVVGIVSLVFLVIGVSFWFYSSRQISLRSPELYIKSLKRQKISGIILILVGITIILLCIRSYLYYSIIKYYWVAIGIFIVWGIFFIALGVGLLGYYLRKIRKERKKKENFQLSLN